MSEMLSFNQAHLILEAAVQSGMRLYVGKAVSHCVQSYEGQNQEELHQQVHLVASTIWKNPHVVLSTILHDVLRPFIDVPTLFPLTNGLLARPDVIRTCLAMAQFIDDERITMDEHVLGAQLRFLVRLPGFSEPGATDTLLLSRTGAALLGGQWLALCAIYNIPLEGAAEFRKALFEVPQSFFKLPSHATGDNPLPTNLLSQIQTRLV